MIYLQLFLSFLQIGMFSFGGGYAAMPLIQNQVVGVHKWLDMKEFTDLITISGMTPGPIAVNSATFVGIRIAGWQGAVIATFGCILPSCLLVSLLAWVYYKYKGVSAMQSVLACLRPAVVALIAAAGISILRVMLFADAPISLHAVSWIGAGLFAAAFVVLRKWKWNPILVMSLCGVVNLCIGILIK